MPTSRYAARLAAAACAAGIALGGPAVGVAPLAAADSPENSAASGDTGGRAEPVRNSRGPKAPPRAGGNGRGATARAAAAEPAAADDEVKPRQGARSRSSGGAGAPAAVDAPDTPTPGAPAPDALAPEAPVLAAPLPAGAPVTQPGPRRSMAARPTATVATAAVREPVVVPAESPVAAAVAPASAPITPANLAAPVGMVTSSAAGILDGLLGSFRQLFEGAALLWRRRLFNEAPTVSPVQLTGLTDGPITGTIGAVDPEDDPLTYAVTGDPLHGTVTVSPDGTYAYTPGAGFAGSDSFIVAVTDSGMHINLLDLRRPKSTDANVSVVQGVQVPLLRFQFFYGSGSQYWSSAARSALEDAAAHLAGYLVVSSPVTITYKVTGQKSPFSSTLATSGSDFTSDGKGFIQTVVQEKIQTGVDANDAAADGEIDWNFGPSWAYGDTVPNNQYDFQSTAMHELVHTLGFMSNVDRAGANTGQTWTVYDGYLVDSGGSAVIGTDYKWKTAYNVNLTGGNGGLFFGGPGAVAAYGGPVPLYTPSPYSSGSSMSHLDDDLFTGSKEKLMNAISGQGRGVRVLSPVELGMLTDIGYQINPSGTTTLVLVGFFFNRRRRLKNWAAPDR